MKWIILNLLFCTLLQCGRQMCYSDEIVKFVDKNNPMYVCKNPEFDQLIKVCLAECERLENITTIKVHRVFCRRKQYAIAKIVTKATVVT